MISPQRVATTQVAGHGFQGTYQVNTTESNRSPVNGNDRYGSTLKKELKSSKKKVSNHRLVDIGSIPNQLHQNQSYET